MASPFVERLLAVVAQLFSRRFTEADGLPERELDAAQSRGGYELPGALRDFYSVVGNFDPVMSAHNRFYLPGSLMRVEGKLVFCEENQVVVYWGFDEDQARQPDPPVYQGVNNDPVEWYLEDSRCSEFLVCMVYWQALNGGLPHVAFARASDSIRLAAAAWPMVWQDEDSQVFSRGTAVFALNREGKGIRIQAAGLSVNDMAEVGEALGVQWSYA